MSQPQTRTTDQRPNRDSSKPVLPRYNYVSLTRVALVLNGLLAAAGYLFLFGYLGTLGIDIGELEIGLPVLLFYGYLFLLKFLTESGVLTILTAGFVLGIAGAVVLLIEAIVRALGVKKLSEIPFRKQIIPSITIVIATMVILLVPALVIQQGEKLAVEDETLGLQLPSPQPNKKHVIATSEGPIRGHLIIADRSFAYVLVGTNIYKINNNTQQIARRIELIPAGSDDEDKDEG